MRTTINLPDALIARAKKLAAESRTTLTAVIESSLRETLARRSRRPRAPAVNLPVFGKGGLQPGVDLDDSAALVDVMEPARDAAPRR
jgi:putative antitoxin of VapBC-like toxin-antitoxin system